MRRHDVPKENVLLKVEICEDTVNDRCRRLARAPARELALGREGDARDASAAVAGGFPDQQYGCGCALIEVPLEP